MLFICAFTLSCITKSGLHTGKLVLSTVHTNRHLCLCTHLVVIISNCVLVGVKILQIISSSTFETLNCLNQMEVFKTVMETC